MMKLSAVAFVHNANNLLRNNAYPSNMAVSSPFLGQHTALHAQSSITTLATCLSYFEGIKTPAVLIAGSSIAALFTMTKDVRETCLMSRSRVVLLRLYHALSLASLCFSLTSVATSQATIAQLLSEDSQSVAGAAGGVWKFLRLHLSFEWIMVQWTFLMSILSLLVATTFRMIIEFGLFHRTRRLAGTMVVTMMGGVLSAILSQANASLYTQGWSNLGAMTKELCQLVWKRAAMRQHHLQLLSCTLLAIAGLCSLKFMLPRSVEQDQLNDIDRFT